MRRLSLTLATAIAALCLPAAAQADFGVKSFDVTFTGEDGANAPQAGAHPFAMTTSIFFKTTPGKNKDGGDADYPDGDTKDLTIAQMPGLVGDPTAIPPCPNALFFADTSSCPRASVLGTTDTFVGGAFFARDEVYNLDPPPGVAQKIGFVVLDITPVTVNLGVSPDPPYNVLAKLTNVPNVLPFTGSELTLWGVPADPAHDAARGGPANFPPLPYLTVPRACEGPLETSYETDSWQDPGALLPGGAPDLSDPAWVTGSVFTHDDADPPNPQGFIGCGKLGFNPSISAQPTTKAASSPTGLDFSLDATDEGLTNPKAGATAQSDIRKVLVTLPEGMSANPSLAEGLEVCTEAQLAQENAFSEAGAGCPDASKIGTVEVETPLLEEDVDGALFIAKPYENPFGSLLALYIVIKNSNLGILVKQPLKVEPDPVTGQLATVAEDLPQLPFSHFRLHFREGARSPLVSPPSCGPHEVRALLYPWAGGAPVESTSTFQIISGSNEGPCPSGGLPPFKPGLIAGTINNRAGSFSPFNLRMSRSDSEQEITHFSIKLPPGVVGKLAGVSTCSDAAIAAATARAGSLGGHEELASPSCPASSYVGRTLVGSGVGPALAYAPGNVYLAGPYHGAPLSIVAITAGVVGPFDIGTVVVREALRIDPETAEVFIDATGSDPIPHIIQGIPVHLRDIRVYTDRPEFVLNPTGCEPTSTASTVLGSGLDFASPADDNPVVVSTRFQAADCAALPFHPELSFKLVGSTKRGGNPSLRAHVAMNGIGEAAIRYAQVALPRSEFLDNAHIGTICTRTQFRQGNIPGENCPAASVYGHVSALTPILDGPLSGPIYLRSSEHELPDLVAALHHEEINVALVGRVDSVKGGGIRNTFEFVPDAPVTSADFVFDGAAKGLLQNSTNLCRSTNKVKVLLKAHSGKRFQYQTPLKPTGCKKGAKKKRHVRHRRSAAR
jgi:hypothetical protein